MGALGYFLLTGHYVFEAESDLALYAKHLTEVPIPPSQRAQNPVVSGVGNACASHRRCARVSLHS